MDHPPILYNEHCDAPFQDLEPDEIMRGITDQHEEVIELYR